MSCCYLQVKLFQNNFPGIPSLHLFLRIKVLIKCPSFFLAIASHKYIIAFCVGLELHNANTPLRLYSTYMLIFSLMSPLGVGIGIGITSATSTQSTAYILSVAILQVRNVNFTTEERMILKVLFFHL